jgi:hypothetical protein
VSDPTTGPRFDPDFLLAEARSLGLTMTEARHALLAERASGRARFVVRHGIIVAVERGEE